MIMKGRKGIIFGVANNRSIAYGIAQSLKREGAEMAFTYAGEIMKDRVEPLALEMGSKLVMPCDVANEEDIKKVFEEFKKVYGELHFVVHAVAYAKKEELAGKFTQTSKDGFMLAMDISAYSLIPVTKYALPLMTGDLRSIITLTYIGGERTIPNYNVMGVAKAALECTVRYLAAELGPQGIRVNALSAGPVKTLALKGIANSDLLLKLNKLRSPMLKNVSLEEVGDAGLYLLSSLSNGVTGETHHVDGGFHSIALHPADAAILGIEAPKEITEGRSA